MFRKNKKFILGILMMMGLTGCSLNEGDNSLEKDTSETQIKEVANQELDDKFVKSYSDFAVSLFCETTLDGLEKGENVLVSPESVGMALAMTANGAKGDTLSQMENVVCGEMSISEYNQYAYTFMEKLSNSQNVKYNIANSVWYKDDGTVTMKDDFENALALYYNAECRGSAFDQTTIDEINNWVYSNTDGMIDNLINKISETECIYLVNAMAFDGEWDVEYEEDDVWEDRKFTNSKGQEENVTMLNSDEQIYISDENSSGFIKPYKGGEYGFMAILPNEGISMGDYVSGMTGDSIIQMFDELEYTDVEVLMPEFSYEYDIELKEDLSNMGMDLPFEMDADFSNMATTDEKYLYINKVIHKTYIDVNRKGTKAAAVTGIGMETLSAPSQDIKRVTLDRPFIYGIVDMETGLPVFMGVLNSVY